MDCTCIRGNDFRIKWAKEKKTVRNSSPCLRPSFTRTINAAVSPASASPLRSILKWNFNDIRATREKKKTYTHIFTYRVYNVNGYVINGKTTNTNDIIFRFVFNVFSVKRKTNSSQEQQQQQQTESSNMLLLIPLYLTYFTCDTLLLDMRKCSSIILSWAHLGK